MVFADVEALRPVFADDFASFEQDKNELIVRFDPRIQNADVG